MDFGEDIPLRVACRYDPLAHEAVLDQFARSLATNELAPGAPDPEYRQRLETVALDRHAEDDEHIALMEVVLEVDDIAKAVQEVRTTTGQQAES